MLAYKMYRPLALSVVVALCCVALQAQQNTSEVRGTVVDEVTHRSVSDSAYINLKNEQSGAGFGTVTDANGSFSFPILPPGQYSLKAEAPRLEPLSIEHLNVTDGGPLVLRLPMEFYTCPEGPDHLPHYYRLLRRTTGDTVALSGTVKDGDGHVIPSATVILYTPTRGRIASVQSDKDGKFSFTDLKLDPTYWIKVQSAGYFPGEFTKLRVLPGYESVYGLALDACQPGHCDPSLRLIRILPGCA